LDWIRSITNFVEFGLDPNCKLLRKVKIRIGFGLSSWKKGAIFVIKKL